MNLLYQLTAYVRMVMVICYLVPKAVTCVFCVVYNCYIQKDSSLQTFHAEVMEVSGGNMCYVSHYGWANMSILHGLSLSGRVSHVDSACIGLYGRGFCSDILAKVIRCIEILF